MLPVNNMSEVVTISRFPVGHTHSQMDQVFRPPSQHLVAAFIDHQKRLHQQNRMHGERVVHGERVLPNNLGHEGGADPSTELACITYCIIDGFDI